MASGKIVKNRTQEWEIQHSLWILWSFFGLGCISFIIISAKLKNKLWAYFALAYTAIFVVAMLTAHDDAPIDASYEFQQGVLTVSAISWVVSIIHCFLVRREYLIGLDTITSDERREEEAERIREKYKR